MTETTRVLVYSGVRHAGFLVPVSGKRFVALGCDGRRLGEFATRSEAVGACQEAAERPAVGEESDDG